MCHVYKRHNCGPAMRTAVPGHGLAQGLYQLLALISAQHIAKPAEVHQVSAIVFRLQLLRHVQV